MPYDAFGNWATYNNSNNTYEMYLPGVGNTSYKFATLDDHVPGTSWPTWENRATASDKADRAGVYMMDKYNILINWNVAQAVRRRYSTTLTSKLLPPTCMAYLTNTKWGSNKFYKILVHNDRIVSQYGRIGRKGTVTNKVYTDPLTRNRAIIDSLRKRLTKEYELITTPPAAILAEYVALTGIKLPEELIKQIEVVAKKRKLRNLIRV